MVYEDVAYPNDLSVREVLNEVTSSLSVLLELHFPVRKMVSVVLSECEISQECGLLKKVSLSLSGISVIMFRRLENTRD